MGITVKSRSMNEQRVRKRVSGKNVLHASRSSGQSASEPGNRKRYFQVAVLERSSTATGLVY